MLDVDHPLQIPLRELRFTFVRSSGAGGQNVNKVNTKAVLRWSLATTQSVPPDVVERLRSLYPRRINESGEVMLSSQRFRDQGRNVADCLGKLQEMLEAAREVPRERRPSRTPRWARRRRLEDKRRQSARKRRRQRPSPEGD